MQALICRCFQEYSRTYSTMKLPGGSAYLTLLSVGEGKDEFRLRNML